MFTSIEISSHSQELIKKYQEFCNPGQCITVASSMDFLVLMSWFDETTVIRPAQSSQETDFALLSLRTELLHDFNAFLRKDEVNEEKKENNLFSLSGKTKFLLLSAAGTLVAAAEGFDSIATMLSVFSFPSAIILGAGLLFSLLSVLAFCGFDLVKLSRALGIKISDTHKLLDIYSQQLEDTKLIRKKLEGYKSANLSIDELKQLQLILTMLLQNHHQLALAGGQFETILHSNQMELAKVVISSIAAALFFGSGFCAGQTFALYVLGLFLSALTPASIPVILFSVLVGLAACCLYWYVDFPGLKGLVSGWFGLNEEKITELCSKPTLNKQENMLKQLNEEVTDLIKLKEQLAEAVQEPPKPLPDNQNVSESVSHDSAVKVSSNIYSFMRPPSSEANRASHRVDTDNANHDNFVDDSINASL